MRTANLPLGLIRRLAVSFAVFGAEACGLACAWLDYISGTHTQHWYFRFRLRFRQWLS